MVELETFKELLSPYKFSFFSYVWVIAFLATGLAFIPFSISLRTKERNEFHCNLRDDDQQCFQKYDSQFNSPLPLHGLVIFNFASMVVVCLVYSCRVQYAVATQVVPMPDEERLRFRFLSRYCKVFRSYLFHLAARLAVLTVFTAFLTKTLHFFHGFHYEFSCFLPTDEPRNITNSNITNREFKSSSRVINCYSPFAREKAISSLVIWVVNVIFLLLVLWEFISLLLQALRNSDFMFDSEFRVKYFINKGETVEYITPLDFRERMRERILWQTERVDRLITREGDKLFDDIFVHPLILQRRANDEDLRRFAESNLTTQHEEGSLMNNYEELFLPNANAASSRKILMVGRPGTGKSLLCTKLLRDWSKNACHIANRFDYAFLFRFRWFNSVAEELKSPLEWLNGAAHSSTITYDVLQQLSHKPEKILLMFDGLDEFDNRQSMESAAAYAYTVRDSMPFFALYLKLLVGSLFPGATILTTCRADVLQSWSLAHFDETVELMGFTKERVLKYVDNYCKQDEDLNVATKIKKHIDTIEKLMSLCCIPVICRMVCYILKDVIDEAGPDTVTLPKTMTSVFQETLKLFIFNHHPECRDGPFQGIEHFPQTIQNDLAELDSLARKGVDEGRKIFSSEEVTTGMRNFGLLHKLPDMRVTPVEWREQFCFIHSALQEFLAAREIAKMDPGTIGSAFDAIDATDPKWQLVIQFVAGLLDGEQREAVNSLVNCLYDSLSSNPIRGKIALLLMKCLYEYNNEATTMAAVSVLEDRLNSERGHLKRFDLHNCQVTPVDCTAVVYFLKHISLRYSLDLSNNSVGEDGCKTLAELIKTKGPVRLDLSNNNITDLGLQLLSNATRRNSSNLEKLHLCFNDSISYVALFHLFDVLTTRNCKVNTLNLTGLQVPQHVFSYLCTSLVEADCKLTVLLLGGGEINDEAVGHLCKSLKHRNCKLTDLVIESEEITDTSLVHLSAVLRESSSKIRTLKLTSQNMTDVGLRHVVKSLIHHNCKLTKLELSSDQITDQSVPHLLKAIQRSMCRLETLLLHSRNVSSSNMEVLLRARSKRALRYLTI